MQLKKILLSTVSVLFIAHMAVAASDGRPRTRSEEDLQTAMALSLSEQDQISGGAARSGSPRGRSASPRRVGGAAASGRVDGAGAPRDRSASPRRAGGAFAPMSAPRGLGEPVILNAESRAVLCDAIRSQLGDQMVAVGIDREVSVSLNGTAYKVRVVFNSFESRDGGLRLRFSSALPFICGTYSSIGKKLERGNTASISLVKTWSGQVVELQQNVDAFLDLTFTKE